MSERKIVLVTGGSRGLGKNMALSIAAEGTDVLLTYHSKQDEAEAVVAEIEKMGQKAAALQLDAGDSGSFNSFLEKCKVLSKRILTQRKSIIWSTIRASVFMLLSLPRPKNRKYCR